MNLQELLTEEICWQQDPKGKRFFFADVCGSKVELRLNNFPDEVACTLFIGGDSLDLDDWGKKWHLPKEQPTGVPPKGE